MASQYHHQHRHNQYRYPQRQPSPSTAAAGISGGGGGAGGRGGRGGGAGAVEQNPRPRHGSGRRQGGNASSSRKFFSLLTLENLAAVLLLPAFFVASSTFLSNSLSVASSCRFLPSSLSPSPFGSYPLSAPPPLWILSPPHRIAVLPRIGSRAKCIAHGRCL
jgi:hypothetical protein